MIEIIDLSIAIMPHQIRLQIIHILENRGTASARDLSRLLNVTQSNIRHHLSTLTEQGSIKCVGYSPSLKRGRPSAMYALIHSGSMDNLLLLMDILLKEFLNKPLQSEKDIALRWLARQLIQGFPQTAHNPTQRLYSAIRVLNQLNYRARWEAHPDTPLIMLDHCPYLAILPEHPEMCQVDAFILEDLLGYPVKHLVKLALNPDGHHQCVFRFAKN